MNEQLKINKHLLPLLGAIAGDFIGSPYELKGCRIKITDFPLFNQYSTFTDDTVSTLAISKWMTNQEADLASILHTLGNRYIDVGFGHAFKEWLRSDDPKPYNSWGNGSAMRVSSVGVVCSYLHEVLDIAKQTAIITHNHPEGIKGAQAVATSVYLAYNGLKKNHIKNYVEKTFGYDLNRTISEIRESYSFDSSCQGSVPESIIAFLESNNFEEAVRLAVSLGGDADTQASIAGAIAAAFYKEIPQNIIETILNKIPNDLFKMLSTFNDIIPPQECSLVVTAKKDLTLKCYIQYSFALTSTDIADITIPKGTRLELTLDTDSIYSNECKSNEEAILHLINNRDIVFSALEQDARLKYSEFIEYYNHLVERIQIFSNISELDDFDISPLTMDDILLQHLSK